MKNSLVLTFGLVVLSLLACVTINVYFPEAAVRDLAVQIEDAVQERAQEEVESPAEEAPPAVSSSFGLPSSRQLLGFLAAMTGGLPAQAQGSEVADPAVSNPAIRKIIESRGRRAP
ncbi:MAG: hypothetical protein KDD47_15125, partial [Acidobacteria bacterium]|nr:hypothetical protein [Acidobacteriota bacterium]